MTTASAIFADLALGMGAVGGGNRIASPRRCCHRSLCVTGLID